MRPESVGKSIKIAATAILNSQITWYYKNKKLKWNEKIEEFTYRNNKRIVCDGNGK